MNALICHGCGKKFLVVFQCDDNKDRCYACKTGRPLAQPSPELRECPAPAAPAPTEHTAIIQAKVHLRNRVSRMESLKDWDKSAWNCGKHEGLMEALEILKVVSQ